LTIHPRVIVRIDLEHFCGNRRNFPAAFQHFVALLFRDVLHQVFSVLQNERIEINERTNPFRKSIRGGAAYDAAAIGMTTQYDVRQFLPANQISDIELWVSRFT
jgi:hypothetical protein